MPYNALGEENELFRRLKSNGEFVKFIWTKSGAYCIIKKPCSRGISGALYLQSATAGVMEILRVCFCEAAFGKWC